MAAFRLGAGHRSRRPIDFAARTFVSAGAWNPVSREAPVILHLVTDLRIGGTQRILLERIRALPEMRHEVLVFSELTRSASGRSPAARPRSLGDSSAAKLPSADREQVPTSETSMAALFLEAGARVHVLGLDGPAAAFRAWISGTLDRRLGFILDKTRPDLLHSTLFHSRLLADRTAHRRDLPHVASKEGIDSWMGPVERALEARALRRAVRVACISEAVRRQALRLGVDAARIRMAPNGIDPSRPGSWRIPPPWASGASAGLSDNGRETARQLELPDSGGIHEAPRVLGIGRLDRAKGWDVLLRAFPAVLASCPAATLDILGTGAEEAGLRRLASRLGLDRAIRIVLPALEGDSDEPGTHEVDFHEPGGHEPGTHEADLHGPAAHESGSAELEAPASRESTPIIAVSSHEETSTPILVVPSREEGFGLILLEGMARGLPIVATTAGGIPEVVRHEREALLVPPDNPEALAAAIIRLARDRELASRLIATGRERVKAFSIHSMVQAYRAIYEEVLEEATSGPR